MSGPPSVQTPRLRFQGSRIATGLLRLGGWRVLFDGLPAAQGVLVVYPHTSNWDFVVAILAKWAIGIPVRFWSKDSLFRVPVFGAWLRACGGVPVDRDHPRGVVAAMVGHMQAQKARGEFFWLGITPEGTRSARPGWRTGFYRVASQAGVPVGLASLDYGRREVRFTDFMTLTGDETADLAHIAGVYAGVRGKRPSQASPVRFMETAEAASDTIVR